MTLQVHGDGFILIPKGSTVSITMKLGLYKCLDRSQAVSTVKMAMDLGIPIDYVRNFKGEFHTFVSRDGVNKLRLKHGWVDPNSKRSNVRKMVRKYRKPPGFDYLTF